MKELFRKFSTKISAIVGSAGAFSFALLVIIVWALTGPIFHYSDTWQLIINTSTTIVTFLMVFLIQNTQNRDARSMHLQLDEIIRSLKSASNRYLDLDEVSDEELDKLQKHFRTMHDNVEKHRLARNKKAKK